VYSIIKKAKPSRLGISLKKHFNKFRSSHQEEEKDIHPPFALLFLDADLIAEFFALIKKPELPQKFSNDGEWSSLNYIKPSSLPYSSIGPMAVALVHHLRMMSNDNSCVCT
jgi:hypothetical protein